MQSPIEHRGASAQQLYAGSLRCTCGKPKAVAAKAFTMNQGLGVACILTENASGQGRVMMEFGELRVEDTPSFA